MSVYEYTVEKNGGTATLDMADFEGKVLLIVNTASECMFTPQFAGLEELYVQYQDQGFTVLGFPCNQFGEQDPAPDSEIAKYCQVNYGVTFPVMAKIEVNGPNAEPLFAWLKSQAPAESGAGPIEWNFTKFLVNRKGSAVARFAPKSEPRELRAAIEEQLN